MEPAGPAAPPTPVDFERTPTAYQHWWLSFDGPIATLAMDVQEDGGLRPDSRLFACHAAFGGFAAFGRKIRRHDDTTTTTL